MNHPEIPTALAASVRDEQATESGGLPAAAPKYPEGWAFQSADFSANVRDFMQQGWVELSRTGRNLRAWENLAPPLAAPPTVRGFGHTFEEAERAAIVQARALGTLAVGREETTEPPVPAPSTSSANRSESLVEFIQRATRAELNACNWRIVHAGLLQAREKVEATGANHSWIGPYINIAAQEGSAIHPL